MKDRNISRKALLLFLFFLFGLFGIGYSYLSSSLSMGGNTKILKPISSVSFAQDSWSTIISIAKSGAASAYYKIGDTKQVTVSGFGTHTVRIANLSTPNECNSSTFSQTACGFVIEFADSITTYQMNSSDSNVGGWPNMLLHSYLNNNIYNALPSDLRTAIINTRVVSGHGSKDSSNTVSTDKLYLLSGMEVWGADGYYIQYDSLTDQTRQLDYYQSIGVTESNSNGANKNTTWWLRDAALLSDIHFIVVGSSPTWPSQVYGVSPAFRLG